MPVPKDYTDRPRWRDLRAMAMPVAIGSGISALLLLIYGFVRFA